MFGDLLHVGIVDDRQVVVPARNDFTVVGTDGQAEDVRPVLAFHLFRCQLLPADESLLDAPEQHSSIVTP